MDESSFMEAGKAQNASEAAKLQKNKLVKSGFDKKTNIKSKADNKKHIWSK
jgi:hypothetical protein